MAAFETRLVTLNAVYMPRVSEINEVATLGFWATWWIAGRHPEWGAALSGFLRERLAVKEMTAEQRADLVQQLAKLARGAAGQDFLAERLSAGETSAQARQMILRAMARAGLKQAPARWLDLLIPTLAQSDGEVVREAATRMKLVVA